MPHDTSIQHILIGTAGHIDHGKTRLVARLTGIDTDRLPEEKARGISIDLGFAYWQAEAPARTVSDSDAAGELDADITAGQPGTGGVRRYQFGIVDVPGHERFVKNMVAGAAGVNMALLVVAADDSVMPQTREHLEIMDFLGVERGVVAITKTDLVDPDFVELVESEIREVIADTFLEECPIVAVSSETGEGIEALREAILEVACEIRPLEPLDLFRMPIDRVFSMTGHGCVVTGSALSGHVQPGDILELQPQGLEVRVRGVENHGLQAADSGAWQRTAINLAGMKNEEIARGQELVSPGYLRPTTRLVVQIRSLAGSSVVLKNRIELNLHTATTEVPARLILKVPQLRPGQCVYGELRLRQPIVAAYGQRFILRRVSPALTVAGGTVLDPYVPPGKRLRELEAHARSLDTPSDAERLSAHFSQCDVVDETPAKLNWLVGIRPSRVSELIQQFQDDDVLVRTGSGDRGLLVHRERLETLSASVLRAVRTELARHQPRRSLPPNTLKTASRAITTSVLLDAVFERLLATKQLVQVGSNWGPADAQVVLSKNQRATRDRLLETITRSGLAPPTVKELASAVGQKPNQIDTLLNLCVEDGLLRRLPPGLHFSPESLERARQVCENLLNKTGPATMSQLREAWETSRKYSVPLCEYFDELGVTVRDGDVRVAGPNVGESLT